MRNLAMVAAAALGGCSAGGEEAATNGVVAQAAGAPTTSAEQPAGSPPQTLERIMGAVPGPCGSTRAQAYLGRTWSKDVAVAVKARSGAPALRMTDEASGADPSSDPRRINVLLSPSRRIILLDCG